MTSKRRLLRPKTLARILFHHLFYDEGFEIMVWAEPECESHFYVTIVTFGDLIEAVVQFAPDEAWVTTLRTIYREAKEVVAETITQSKMKAISEGTYVIN